MSRGYGIKLLLLVAISMALGGLSACSENVNRSKGVYMLLDTSGTYAEELNKAQAIINYLLGTLQSGDTLAVARIDTGSFSEQDILAKVTFDQRPSVANTQKRAFKKKIDDFVNSVEKSSYTDISGGLLQAIEFLNESGAGQKYVLIFSDLQEDLAKGHIRNFILKLSGFNVVALHVTKLRNDIRNPNNYLDRVEQWREKIESSGGKWRVINNLERLGNIF